MLAIRFSAYPKLDPSGDPWGYSWWECLRGASCIETPHALGWAVRAVDPRRFARAAALLGTPSLVWEFVGVECAVFISTGTSLSTGRRKSAENVAFHGVAAGSISISMSIGAVRGSMNSVRILEIVQYVARIGSTREIQDFVD